jgi:hypothetical protein
MALLDIGSYAFGGLGGRLLTSLAERTVAEGLTGTVVRVAGQSLSRGASIASGMARAVRAYATVDRMKNLAVSSLLTVDLFRGAANIAIADANRSPDLVEVVWEAGQEWSKGSVEFSEEIYQEIRKTNAELAREGFLHIWPPP